MREFLSGLFEVSLTMGAVTALLLILSPVWKRRFRPQWRCWAWLLVALRLAVPFNESLPRAPVVLEAPAPAAVSAAWVEEEGFQGVELTARTLPPGEAAPEAVERGLSLTTAELAFAVWAAVAAGVLAGRLLWYAAFRRRTARWCTPAGTYEGVPVYACALLSSPALTGLLRPRILLPEGVEEERRAFALAHEAMHARRRDLWRKALLLWVCALHWFNPLVWLLRRAAERDMEIACDAAVLAGRDGEWRRRYGAALLSFVPVGRPAPLTSQFAGGARGLKERFRALMDASAKRPGRAALLLVLCAALLGGPLVACQSRAPEESLPDGTYWATLSLPDGWTAGEEGTELLLSLAEVDTDTMTLLSVAPEKTSLPVADDVTLGNHGDSGLDSFLQWAALSSYWPMVLEAEVAGGEITALTWHDANLPLDPNARNQWEQTADHPASPLYRAARRHLLGHSYERHRLGGGREARQGALSEECDDGHQYDDRHHHGWILRYFPPCGGGCDSGRRGNRAERFLEPAGLGHRGGAGAGGDGRRNHRPDRLGGPVQPGGVCPGWGLYHRRSARFQGGDRQWISHLLQGADV